MIDPSALRAAKAVPAAWGLGYGGTGAPSGNGYTKIYSNNHAFVALKADGSITVMKQFNEQQISILIC
jgi:hypothetical protein